MAARTTSNDLMARLQKEHWGRFVGVAGIDCGNVLHDSLAELDRCAKLGLRVAFIEPGRSPGCDIDDRRPDGAGTDGKNGFLAGNGIEQFEFLVGHVQRLRKKPCERYMAGDRNQGNGAAKSAACEESLDDLEELSCCRLLVRIQRID